MDHHPQHFQQPQPRHHGGYGGESNEQSISRHSPQHYQHLSTVPSWNGNVGYGKRGRESPTFSDSGMQCSFKRLKVMDECSSTADSLYSTTTNYSSFEPSRFDAMAPQLKEEHGVLASHNLSSHLHHPEPCQRQVTEESMHREQSAGEQSCEPSLGYQSMNSMLHNLHIIRRQRTEGAQPAAQHPAPSTGMDHVPSHSLGHPVSRGSPHKKQVSLRCSSKLY
jgi:hypothetical protein